MCNTALGYFNIKVVAAAGSFFSTLVGKKKIQAFTRNARFLVQVLFTHLGLKSWIRMHDNPLLLIYAVVHRIPVQRQLEEKNT